MEIAFDSMGWFRQKMVAVQADVAPPEEEKHLIYETVNEAAERMSILHALQVFDRESRGRARGKETLKYVIRLLLQARRFGIDIASWSVRTPVFLALFEEAGIFYTSEEVTNESRLYITDPCWFPYLPVRTPDATEHRFRILDVVVKEEQAHGLIRSSGSPSRRLSSTVLFADLIDSTAGNYRIRVGVYGKNEEGEKTLRGYDDHDVVWSGVEGVCHEIIQLLNRCNQGGKVSPDILNGLQKNGNLLFELLIPQKTREKLCSVQTRELFLNIHEGLVQIPWELLFDGREFLSRRFAMGRIVNTRQVLPARSERVLKLPFKVLVLADPEGDLDASYSEGIAVRDFLDERRETFRVDSKTRSVSVAFVKKNLRDYDIVHYAGHANYHAQRPSASGWRLTDGTLTASEISAMGGLQPMPLLVFSHACQTGHGDWHIVGDFEQQIGGVANAYLLAGVQHYIGTFWQILDQPSLSFAKSFYSFLTEGETIGEAVRRARLDLIGAYGEETVVWASYMLYGDPTFKFAPSSATAPETRRLTAQSDLDQTGVGSPPRSIQPAPQSALSPMPSTASAPGAARRDRPAPERRQLTVMFCDLVEATALSGRLDPEDLRDVLRAYMETCAEVIARFGGNIEKFLGEGVLVCFGYPQAHDDDPQRAVRAGLRIIESIARLNTRLAQLWGIQLEVRLGIHTGLVVAGDLGVRETQESQAIVGEAPNIAARLQEVAASNTVVISAATARLVGGYFTLDALGPQVLKGIAIPVPVYRVVGETAAQTRFDVAAARGLTPFVGREHEVALLLGRWAAAKDSRGQVILLSGEAGIGKSRLVRAFREHLTSEAYTWIAYHCSSYYQQSAFYPVVEHIQRLLQFRKDDTPEEKLHKLEAMLGPYDFALEEVVPLLAALLSLSLPERYPPLPLTPEQQKQKTLEALLTWLLKEAERQPVCMIMEDLHWGDASTLEWLCLLIDQVPTACMLLLLLCRPEFHPPWAPRTHLTPITLQTLGRAQVEAMTTHVAGGKTLPSGLITQIVEKTDGVPLFVEEMIKAIVESNVLRDVGDHYALTGPVEAVRIPMSLHDTLMARLDRLHTAKRLAQLGAVIGRQFSYDLVKALTAYDESRLQQELGQLVDAELLYQRGLPPRATYMFKHALIQDVAYESLLRRQRQTLHGTIADAIEALEGVRVAAQAGILAYHYARSLHQDKAITYALLAGDEAVRLHARTEATTHYVQALTLVRGLPVTPEAQRMQIDAILKLATVSSSREDLARDQANLEQAQTLAETLQDQPRLAQVLYWQGRLAYVRGDLQTAIIYAEQSLAVADRLEDETLSAPPVNLLGRSYTMWWDVARGSQLLVRSTAQMHQIGSRVEEATAAGFAAMAFGALGEFAQALAYGDRGIALARESTNPFAEAAAVFYRGVAHTHQGAWTQALADFDAARGVAKRVGDHFRVYVVNLYAGWASTRAGDPAAGRVLLDQAFTIAEQIGTVFHVALGKAWLAACALALGALDTVPALCQEALRVARETSDRFAQAVAHRALAEALTLGTAPDRQQAEQAMEKAIQCWKEIAFNPELARTYVSYARLLQGWGQDGQAKVYLTEAIAMFQKMGMEWDLTQVVVLS